MPRAAVRLRNIGIILTDVKKDTHAKRKL
jgi:hypothetical protein